jgi:DMSO/TMAO reductase YedYZ molybdopterin-dependent catalytic subunit
MGLPVEYPEIQSEQGRDEPRKLRGKAMKDCLLAYGQNGEAVRPEQGHPLRLLVPGYEGNMNVKWLRRLQLADKPFIYAGGDLQVHRPAAQRKGGAVLFRDGGEVGHYIAIG